MKIIWQKLFVIFSLFFLSGCTIRRTHDSSLQGTAFVNQENHLVQVMIAKAWHSKGSNDLHLWYDGARSGEANVFVFMFSGNKQISVDSIHASYCYESRVSQPLELAELDKNMAVFFLRPSQPTPLESGRYNLNLEYVFNGQGYSCAFKLKYVDNTKIRVGWWSPFYVGPGG